MSFHARGGSQETRNRIGRYGCLSRRALEAAAGRGRTSSGIRPRGKRQAMNSAIRTDDLGKKFRRVTALDKVNLDVPEGAIYALVGPNGAGKTTAIKVLMNIFPPTSGRAEVLGIDSRRIAGRSFISIGYVSENQELPDWMRIDQFLAYLRPFYPAWDRALEDGLVKQ